MLFIHPTNDLPWAVCIIALAPILSQNHGFLLCSDFPNRICEPFTIHSTGIEKEHLLLERQMIPCKILDCFVEFSEIDARRQSYHIIVLQIRRRLLSCINNINIVLIGNIEYMADVLTVGDLEERVALVDELMKNGKITFLQDYTARKKKEDVRYERRKDADLAL